MSKHSYILTCIAIFTTVVNTISIAQEIRFIPVDSLSEEGISQLIDKEPVESPEAALQKFLNSGFLEASVDSIYQRNDTIFIHLYSGPQYNWKNFKIPEEIRAAVGFTGFEGNVYNQKQVDAFMEQVLIIATDHGYPFAEVYLDSIQVEGEAVSAVLNFHPGAEAYFSEIQLKGEKAVHKDYLYNYLSLKPGDLYQGEKIRDVEQKLEELPFLQQDTTPQVTFFHNTATLSLYLQQRNINRFDVLIGLIPEENRSNRVQLTGVADLDLINQFQRGERIFLKYSALGNSTQDFHTGFRYPYIAGLPFGTDISFSLYKKDSLFLDLRYNVGLEYLFNGWNFLKIYVENRTSRLISIDEEEILRTGRLPDVLDFTRSIFGLEFHRENYDYRLNPRRGYMFNIKGGAGYKRIKQNEAILSLSTEEVNISQLYASLKPHTWQADVEAMAAVHLPLLRQSTVRLQSRTGYMASGRELLANDLFRLGGQNTIRGFIEDAFRAKSFVTGTIEYRLLLNRNSNVFAYYDSGLLLQEGDQQFLSGFGIGLNLDTRIGIFGITYGVGKSPGEPVRLQDGKVHFGMRSLF